MNILPYKLGTTNDLLTSRTGLLSIAELMNSLNLTQRINQHFPLPKSNRGYLPSKFIQTFILMQHEGSFHLDEVRRLEQDDALRSVLGINKLPKANTLGEWLKRMGNQPQIHDAWVKVNQTLLQSALHRCKKVTLDIDATEIVANKACAKWTYKKNKGYMPMVGHIAQTGQVVAVDFRQGNVSPAKDNLAFIKQCQEALPKGAWLKALRIDAAGYQADIIKYCDEQNIQYAIGAKSSTTMREQIEAISSSAWQPLLNKQGQKIKGQDTYRTSFCIGEYEKPFTLVVQRTAIKGQGSLELDSQDDCDQITLAGYCYRAIATNYDQLSDSELIHWYNQRGEDSENRIKELKLDFGADTLPSSDFGANALYFSLAALSYNLFALMRELLPTELSGHRAITLRWRLYGMAGKVVRSNRQLFVKLADRHRALLEEVLTSLKRFEPPPI